MNHLYQSKGEIHACESGYAGVDGRSPLLVWTKCGKDVPANASFKSWEGPTCMDCALAMDQEKIDALRSNPNPNS